MPVVLASHVYGKANVRLTRITRHADRHDLAEWSVDIGLEGDFAASYTAGDNRLVVPTDTMRNRVYVIGSDAALTEPEDFALRYTAEFLADYPQVAAAIATVAARNWVRIAVHGQANPHSFVGGGDGERTCRVRRSRDGTIVSAGIRDLPILKTSGSAFRDFHRDQFTTLADTDDRILATRLTACWKYADGRHAWRELHGRIASRLLGVFADHQSLGVQHTLFAMGQAVLDAEAAVDEIELQMPNQHRIPFNLEPFGLRNSNSVFVTTSEPSGQISARLARQ